MEYATLTKDLRQYFGITSAHITFENNDFIIMLKKLSDKMILFTCPFIGLRFDDEIKLVFNSNKGFVELQIKVECFYENNNLLVVEGSFICVSNEDFFIEFESFLLNLINQKKRKEERILCTQKNLMLLNLINTFFFEFKCRQFKAIIKDISYSGIRVLCNTSLLQENGSLFNFKIRFNNPTESFLFVNSRIVRKELYTFEDYNFAEIVFEISDNIKYKERIDKFFKRNLINHR